MKKKIIIIFLTLIISFSTVFIAFQLSTSPKQNQRVENDTLSANAWALNGIPLVNETEHQQYPQLCEDGSGGAIIVWRDLRYSYSDIFVQRMNSSGDRLWAYEGVPICTAFEYQNEPQITSDGAGGAIAVWTDRRTGIAGTNYDIYAQRINSTGHILWTPNGTVICNESNAQDDPQIISDGDEGAIIVWADPRLTDLDIYAQRINSSGSVLWGPNGTVICDDSDTQDKPQLCSDGDGGAFITWQHADSGDRDIYAQRINSSGDVQWTPNGDVISSGDWKGSPQIVSDGIGGTIMIWTDTRGTGVDIYGQRIDSDGTINWTANGEPIIVVSGSTLGLQMINDSAGGAILTWWDNRLGSNDIYVQRINSSSGSQWTPNGVPICTDDSGQSFPKLAGDRLGGAFISWVDARDDAGDVYAQYVNSTGQTQWSANGSGICTAGGGQDEIQLFDVGDGGAILIWQDSRIALNDDLYVSYVKNAPTSNHPDDIITTASGSQTIDWKITDVDATGGQYRVWASDPSEDYYILVNWTPWSNDTLFIIEINRTAPGTFEYILNFYDNVTFTFGVPDSVTVTILDLMPTSNQPADINTTTLDSGTINWRLYDDFGSGQFRVWVNDTNNIYHVWYDWTPWTNTTIIYIPINRIATGTYNYTIEYNSTTGQMTNDTVIVTITSGTPGTPDTTPSIDYETLLLLMGALLVINLLATIVMYGRLNKKINKLKKPKTSPKEPLPKK